jgi:pyruvate-formate lyase-activating enzyme
MKNCVLIDSIADYSFVKSFYKYNVLDPFMLILSNMLKSSFCKVSFLDTKDPKFELKNLHEIIRTEHPDFIIFKSDKLNVRSIERLNLHLINKNLYIITVQKDLLVPPMYTKIFIDESIEMQDNIEKIMNSLDIDFKNSKWKYNANFWDEADKLLRMKYTPLVSIGSGCDRGCSFCTINNTQVKFNDIHLIVDEINYLLTEKKVSTFHIQNHNIKPLLLESLCKEIAKKQFNTKFSWSCYLSPESLEIVENNNEFFNNIEGANLKQVFLEVEHINNDILKHYNISYDRSKLIDNIKKMFDSGIISIVINYIIGSKYESSESMRELINFSKQLLEETHGALEFNVSYYSDKYHVNYLQKVTSDNNSNFLTKYQIMNYKKELFSLTLSYMQNKITNWSVKEKYNHLIIMDQGIKTQYWFYVLSRTAFFNLYFATKQSNTKYSFQIKETDLLDYTPYTNVIVEFEGEQAFIAVDSRLNYHRINKMRLNDVELFLLDIAKRYRPLSDIVKSVCERGYDYNQALKITLNFYSSLEELGLLTYYKSL